MKLLRVKRRNLLLALTVCVVFGSYAQEKQTRNKKESFSVNKDVTIDINTSYTNIEFETWDKNTVEIEAVFEIEGLSKEEANEYFENWDFEASGNKEKVTITSTSNAFFLLDDFNIIIPDLNFDFDFKMPEIDFDFGTLELLDLTAIPPIPPLPASSFSGLSFDYEAYRKDGDAYLKKWKKEFNKEFDGEYKKELEEWRKEIKEWKKKYSEEYKQISKQKVKLKKEEVEKIKAEARRAVEEARKATEEARRNLKSAKKYSIDGKDKNLNIKKTIKIKMPKGAKLKMNVRHGEVKLAQHLKNIKATLSHTRLLADVVDGEYTDIEVSYAPVDVKNWNYGQLKVNYIDEVAISNARNLRLTSNSSNVTIDKLINEAIISGSLGELRIDNINDAFSSLDIVLENTEAILVLPESAFTVYCNGDNSVINLPKEIVTNISKNGNTKLIKGYHKQKSADKSIYVNAKFSNITMQ